MHPHFILNDLALELNEIVPLPRWSNRGLCHFMPLSAAPRVRSQDALPTQELRPWARERLWINPRGRISLESMAAFSMFQNLGMRVTVLHRKPITWIYSQTIGQVLVVRCVCFFRVQQRSDLGAVGTWWRRKCVRATEVAQRGGALWLGGRRQRDARVLVVGVEAQPLVSVAQVVWESRAERVRRTGGAVAVVGTRVQLIQRDGGDGRAVHGERVAGVAGKVWERVRSRHGARVLLRVILLTAVILQRADRDIGEVVPERPRDTAHDWMAQLTFFKKVI